MDKPIVLEDLPEELLRQIASCLDHDGDCAEASHQEPSIEHAASTNAPLKNMSLVSHAWRIRVFKMLFRHLHVKLVDAPSTASPGSMATSRIGSVDSDSGSFHDIPVDRPPKVTIVSPLQTTDDDFFEGRPRATSVSSANGSNKQPRRLSHSLPRHAFVDADADGLIDFCNLYHITDKVRSILVSTREIFDYSKHNPLRVRLWVETFWEMLLTGFDVEKVTVIAPPSTLAILSKTHIITGDAWEFAIPYQRLDLHRNRGGVVLISDTENTGFDLDHSPDSLLNFTKWTKASYNEGSSLGIYSSYHYYEKQPPCIINNYSPNCFVRSLGGTLTSFSWTAIFPHIYHMEEVFDVLLYEMPHLVRLQIQLIPSPDSTALDDTDRVSRGRLRLKDCWSEVSRAYKHIAVNLQHQDCAPKSLPRIRKFKSLDCHHASMKQELDEVFEEFAGDWTCVGGDEWHWGVH